MGIGKTLSDILDEKNRNPNELADKIGESPSTIYSIIRRDNMKVDIAVLAKICFELGVDMERFYIEYVNNTSKLSFQLSDHEKEVIIAYRQQPSLQIAVDRTLGVTPLEDKKEKRAKNHVFYVTQNMMKQNSKK